MPGSSILLLNPRRRRRRRLSNPRRSRHHARRSNPRRTRYHRRRSNPRRRHEVRAHVARSVRGRRFHVRRHLSNPRVSRRRRSNPRAMSLNPGGLLREYVMPAGIGAVGAIGLKIGWGYVSPHLPAAVQSGWGAMGAQAAVVLAGGYGLGKVLPRHRRGIALGVVGALTVIAYSAAVQLLSTYAPNLQGINDYTDYTGTLGAYMPGRLVTAPAALPAGAAAGAPRLGLVSPAPALRGLNAYMTY